MMRRDGHLAFAPNLQTASGADLGAQLGDALGNSRVFCENDANCATLAEHEWGAARGLSDFVMVTLGTGIGGGIVADGQLVRGQSGFAGEIGHMVVEARGAPCLCGGRGCWERYASGGGLHRLTRDAALEGRLPELVERSGGDWRAVRAEDVSRAASEGLDEAVALMREVGWWLALGLANLAAILDAGHFVIGGGLSEASRTRAARRARLPGRPGRGIRDASHDHRDDVIVRSSLGRHGCRTRGLRRGMKLGVLLPTFQDNADKALAFANDAYAAGHRRRVRLRPPLSYRFARASYPRTAACVGGHRYAHAPHRRHPRRARGPRESRPTHRAVPDDRSDRARDA